MSCCFNIAHNGLGIAEGGDFYYTSPIEEQKLTLAQMSD